MANHHEPRRLPGKSATFLPVDIFVDKKFRLVFSLRCHQPCFFPTLFGLTFFVVCCFSASSYLGYLAYISSILPTMLVAFRRSAVSHALRSSPRTLSARPTPQRLQSLYSSITGPSYAPKSLFHSSPFRFSSSAISVETDATEKFDLDQPGQSTSFRKLAEDGTVSRPLIDCITSHLRLENMTEVQRLTIPESVNGGDLFVCPSQPPPSPPLNSTVLI